MGEAGFGTKIPSASGSGVYFVLSVLVFLACHTLLALPRPAPPGGAGRPCSALPCPACYAMLCPSLREPVCRWQLVGQHAFTGIGFDPYTSSFSVAVSPSGSIHAAYSTSSGYMANNCSGGLASFNGTHWVQREELPVLMSSHQLAADNKSGACVAYQLPKSTTLSLRCTTLAPGDVSSVSRYHMALDSFGWPVVAYIGVSSAVSVIRFTGTTWASFASAGNGETFGGVRLVLGASDTPVLSYFTYSSGGQTNVVRYYNNATNSWAEVAAVHTCSPSSEFQLAVNRAPGGAIYLACIYASSTTTGTSNILFRHWRPGAAGGWVPSLAPLPTPWQLRSICMAVGSGGEVHLAGFRIADAGSGLAVSLLRFTPSFAPPSGSVASPAPPSLGAQLLPGGYSPPPPLLVGGTWEVVGTTTPIDGMYVLWSTMPGLHTQLALDSNRMPYVAFPTYTDPGYRGSVLRW